MIVLSHKSILVSELRIDNLNDFYEGLPHRYNSIIDLLHHKQEICVELLKRLRLTKTLKYRLVIASNEKIRIPLLECLEINGLLGGMLSTYLHDHDRNIIESSGNIIVNPLSSVLWKILVDRNKYSFIFPASRNREESRTSRYMSLMGFNEENMGDMRCFYNGENNAKSFKSIMEEFSSAINQSNNYFKYRIDNFEEAKITQSKIATRLSLLL